MSIYIWANYNNSLTWIKAIWGWFPLLTMIIVRSQWGRYNLPRYIWSSLHIFVDYWTSPLFGWFFLWLPHVTAPHQAPHQAPNRAPHVERRVWGLGWAHSSAATSSAKFRFVGEKTIREKKWRDALSSIWYSYMIPCKCWFNHHLSIFFLCKNQWFPHGFQHLNRTGDVSNPSGIGKCPILGILDITL